MKKQRNIPLQFPPAFALLFFLLHKKSFRDLAYLNNDSGYLLRISRVFQGINGFVYICFQKESKTVPDAGFLRGGCANPGSDIHRFQQCT